MLMFCTSKSQHSMSSFICLRYAISLYGDLLEPTWQVWWSTVQFTSLLKVWYFCYVGNYIWSEGPSPGRTIPWSSPKWSGFLYWFRLFIRFRFGSGAESCLDSVSESRMYLLYVGLWVKLSLLYIGLLPRSIKHENSEYYFLLEGN